VNTLLTIKEEIHKELQKRRNPNSRTIQPTSIYIQSNPKTTVKASSTEFNPSPSQNRTYANVTSNQEPPKSDNSNQFIDNKRMDRPSGLIARE